jgi:large subunit ribosomal protein L5
MATMPRLQERYRNEIASKLAKELGKTNPMAIPKLDKIVISMGVGLATQDKKRIEHAARDLGVITGQKPLVCKARKSVSNFKVREGAETGLKVTLRGARMYEFLDRLINVTVPRVRDFRGLNPQSFDGRGNYSMGLSEQTVFPEVNLDQVEFPQGMNITIVTTARNDADGRALLQEFGMPFRS